jgi:hypothetical protein
VEDTTNPDATPFVIDNAGNVGVGTTSPGYKLEVSGTLGVTSGADIQNMTVGKGSGAFLHSTAVGFQTLRDSILGSGDYNTAIGYQALASNTNGLQNTAVGSYAVRDNSTGLNNTGLGYGALILTTLGDNNTAVGADALKFNTIGGNNVALGNNAGSALTTGSNNTLIGSYAGTAGLSGTVVISAGTTERLRIDSSGNSISSPPATPPTLATNGQMVMNLTSNTNLRISVRGSDGTTRVANITLA